MEQASQLSRMKIKLGIPVTDNQHNELLNLLLDDAQNDILGITHQEALPAGLQSTQVELAIIRYNKLGIEGQSAHSEGGISRSFEDIPKSMMNKIRSFRRLPR